MGNYGGHMGKYGGHMGICPNVANIGTFNCNFNCNPRKILPLRGFISQLMTSDLTANFSLSAGEEISLLSSGF
jgi:hypothetical protein